MSGLPKILMTLGAVLFIVGFLLKFTNLGRLPGDLLFRKGNTAIYFPIVTSIIVSVVLSAIFYVISRFR
ncbi:DUF2905 domain-containing protein [Bacillus massiliglaciei]|uniref:DUF2905 domain-containing protein n=1 Tax=Bacillus massiliglaciei TaxID=1816693 RepID=UPI000A7ABA3E|nr:DUF2905 domain-containing protein [Bacillus massiliglaciei]